MLTDVAMATNFGMQFAIIGSVGYNCGCMIASDTLFDSRCGFSGTSYSMKTQPFLALYGVHICATWQIELNRPYAAAMRPYVKLL